MARIVVILLCGLPGTGKTTFAKALQAHFADYNVILFHYDEFCQTFQADERKTVFKLIESKCLEITNAAQSNSKSHLIVVDDNNYYRSMRYAYLQLCRKLTLGYLVVFFDFQLEIALERNSKRNKTERVPDSVIINMNSKLEAPNGSYVLTISNYQVYDFDSIDRRIVNALKHPQKSEETKLVTMPPSLMQLVDLVLRKIVNRKTKHNRADGKELNYLKRQLFADIKAGCIKLQVDEQSSNLEIEEELSKYF